ncbi:MAG: hypothetical protein CMJ50_01030 [Planctomycetaceae bacterium]|nr:hypothetical protein [Planctomycetaceae bacterium]
MIAKQQRAVTKRKLTISFIFRPFSFMSCFEFCHHIDPDGNDMERALLFLTTFWTSRHEFSTPRLLNTAMYRLRASHVSRPKVQNVVIDSSVELQTSRPNICGHVVAIWA